MRSLLRLLRKKAFSSVHSKRTNDPCSMDRSPFSEGATDIEYSNASCADTSSCQSTQLNALADLAQRVSSTAEYGVTSAADFLSGTKSVELDDVYDEHRRKHATPWPFSSFAQVDSAEEMVTVDKDSVTGKTAAFEFTPPRPVADDDSDKPACTLFKWGTIDTVGGSEITEGICNNASHHYDSWEEGGKTPFDSAIETTSTPFAYRQDSARKRRHAGVMLDKSDLNLRTLQQYVGHASAGATLDLGGKHIVEDGILSITASDITLRNGTLELSQGLSVSACRVNLHNLTLISKSSKTATLRASKKGCSVMECDITNTEGVGVQVTGMGSTVLMQHTTVHDCERSCICVNRGGILKVGEGCVIQGSRKFHGISATDAGTELWIEKSEISNHFQDGIYVTNSAHADIDSCEIFGSRTFHGVAGKKFGTTIILRNCSLHSFQASALIVEMGAKAKATDASFRKCNNSPGIVADGCGSHVDVLNSEISECNVGGILIQGGALSKFTRTHVFGSAYGNGVVVAENGSHARMVNCVVFQNWRHGVLVLDAGRATMEGCDVSSSAAGCGIFAQAAGSCVLAEGCQLSNNHSSNICVDDGAYCHASHCSFRDAKVGPNVLARGRRTAISLVVAAADAESLQNKVCLLKRATITLNEKKCKNKQKWPKLKQSSVFSCHPPFDFNRERY